jgi:hypothetical protein
MKIRATLKDTEEWLESQGVEIKGNRVVSVHFGLSGVEVTSLAMDHEGKPILNETRDDVLTWVEEFPYTGHIETEHI